MTRIGLLGDVHGNVGVVVSMLDKFKQNGIRTVLQVGDFGFWPGVHGQTFLTLVESKLHRNEQTLLVTPGNHEDYNQIKNFPLDAEGWQKAKPRIFVAPRGHRWEWEGVSFVSLGGAPSVDRAWRLKDQRKLGYPLWWAEEDITAEDMYRTVEGGRADVMIAHDAPLGVPQIETRIAGNPLGFTALDRQYADEGRFKMRQVVEAVRPKLFVHGHYHFPVDDKLSFPTEEEGVQDTVRIFGLNADGDRGTCAVLDLATLKVAAF